MKKDSKEIKSGAEIIDDFFKNINKIKDVDIKVSNLFSTLHSTDKFTETNIRNGLIALRENKHVSKD